MTYNKIQDLNISYMGLGIMRHDNNQNNTNSIIQYAMEHGINYFEACDFYNKGQCEERLKTALSAYPRNKYYLCDKLPLTGFFGRQIALKDFFQQQLQKMNTDYFDVYLIQAVDRNNIDLLLSHGVIDFFNSMREQGYIKLLGFSFHDNADCLSKVIALNNWDIVQLQLNYYDWYLGVGKDIYQVCKQNDLPIITMGPTKGGLLTRDLPQSSQQRMKNEGINPVLLCYDFLTTLSNVKIILSGAEKIEYLQENIKYFSQEDYGITKNAKEHILKNIEDYAAANLINCTNCQYCIKHCPKQIPINEIFANYNQFLLNRDIINREQVYKTFKNNKGTSDCIGCGACEAYCPQHLPIRQYFHKQIFALRQ